MKIHKEEDPLEEYEVNLSNVYSVDISVSSVYA